MAILFRLEKEKPGGQPGFMWKKVGYDVEFSR